jgi:hypothetical protein
MFEFKKVMKGIAKKEDFECDCCGSVESQDFGESSGCAPSCAPGKSSFGKSTVKSIAVKGLGCGCGDTSK